MAHDIFKTIKARITKSYNENAKLKAIRSTSGIFILAGKRLTADEIAACYYSVEAFTEEDELKAVGKLINDDIYNDLDEEAKERYVLNAANLYSELRKDLLRHRKNA